MGQLVRAGVVDGVACVLRGASFNRACGLTAVTDFEQGIVYLVTNTLNARRSTHYPRDNERVPASLCISPRLPPLTF